MDNIRWWNQSHPQTLQIGIFLCYFEGIFGLLGLGGGGLRIGIALAGLGPRLSLLLAIFVAFGWVAVGLGLANDKRVAYKVGIVMSVLQALFTFYALVLSRNLGFAIGLIFEVALVAALLHDQTRDYSKFWFS